MIRPAGNKDMGRILEIYGIARDFMRQNNNAGQWGDAYPPKDMLENDICAGQLYVYVEDDAIHGVFAYFIGDEPAYAYIENGSWKNGGAYGTIHRVASGGAVKGVLSNCLEYCKKRSDNIRIDTHENNSVMRHLLVKHGFERRGIIYLADSSPRIAYEYNKLR